LSISEKQNVKHSERIQLPPILGGNLELAQSIPPFTEPAHGGADAGCAVSPNATLIARFGIRFAADQEIALEKMIIW